MAEPTPDLDPLEAAFKEAFGERIQNDDILASAVWLSMCNTEWVAPDGCIHVYSFRGAGGVVAAIRGEGDYLDWYCSAEPPYVVSPDIGDAMAAIGWTHRPYEAPKDLFNLWDPKVLRAVTDTPNNKKYLERLVVELYHRGFGDAHSCDHCGQWLAAGAAHDCPESHPKPDLLDRLREDHCDTTECEHGFALLDGAKCPNVVCLARDLREAADEIERLDDAARGCELIIFSDRQAAADGGFRGACYPANPHIRCWWPALGESGIRYLPLRRVTVTGSVRIDPKICAMLRKNQQTFGNQAIWMEL